MVKNDKYNIDDILDELFNDNTNELTEIDFYPPADSRVLESYIEDIYGGDNFSDYCEYIFSLYEDEEYYD